MESINFNRLDKSNFNRLKAGIGTDGSVLLKRKIDGEIYVTLSDGTIIEKVGNIEKD